MTKPNGPKSAYELAMEKLEALDRESGETPRVPLSADQKARITNARNASRAEIAEWEILREQRLAETAGDPVQHAEMQEKIEIDRKRIDAALEAKIAKIREQN